MEQSDAFINIVKRRLKVFKPDEFKESEFDRLDKNKQVQVAQLLVSKIKPEVSDDVRISLIWERYQFLLKSNKKFQKKRRIKMNQ